GPQADVEVELLAEGDVEGADPAAHGRGQRALDADQVLAERVERRRRHPLLRLVEGLLPRQDLQPGDRALPAERLLHRGVEDALGSAADVAAGAIPLDEGNDGPIGDAERSPVYRDRIAGRWGHGRSLPQG